MATARQIVSEVQELIGQAAGSGVQIYDEDGQLAAMQRAFRLLFTRFPWDHFLNWQTLSLNGSTGLLTGADFTLVNGLEDFISIHRDGEEAQIPKLARRTNPNTLGTGTRVITWASLPYTDAAYLTKRLQFYPITATGDVNVCTRITPADLTWNTDIPMDKDMLVAATAWQCLSMDDLNPGAAAGQKEFMETRFSTIIKALARQPISSGSRTSGIPTDYYILP